MFYNIANVSRETKLLTAKYISMKLNMKNGFLPILCFMAILAFHSCSHERFDGDKRNSDFSVEEARAYFENNATDLRYNELIYSRTPTKADDNIVPQWKNAKHGTTPNSEVVMIPILEPNRLGAALTTTLFGLKEGTEDDVKVESHLVIQKYNATGKMRRFITTVVGISNDAKANPYIFTGDRTKFRGFMLISNENGKCEEVFYYMGGRRFKMHIGNYTAEEKNANKHLQVSVGFSFTETSIATKGGGGHQSGEDGDSYCYNCHSLTDFDSGVCAICGAEPQEIGGGEAYFFCRGCGKLIESCTCQPEPTPTPDPGPENPDDGACPRCGNTYCNGECQHTGSGGGDGGNGKGDKGNDFKRKKGYKLSQNREVLNEYSSYRSLCVPVGMAYISAFFGIDVNPSVYILEYCKITNVDYGKVVTDGFDTKYFDLSSFVDKYFYTTDFISYTNAIDSGYLVMVSMYGGENIRHNIVIVGYYPDGTLIYMDPESNSLKEGGENITSGNYVYVITGNKDK